MNTVIAHDPGEPQHGHPRVGIDPQEARILSLLVHEGMNVLEVGTGLGVSTRALAKTGVWLDTIDIDPWVHKTIWPQLYRDTETVGAHVSIWDEWPNGGRAYDLAFIDGNHDYAHVRDDLNRALDRMAPRGVIVIHDMFHNPPTVQGAVAEVLGPCGQDYLTVMNTRYGLGLLLVCPELDKIVWERRRELGVGS